MTSEQQPPADPVALTALLASLHDDVARLTRLVGSLSERVARLERLGRPIGPHDRDDWADWTMAVEDNVVSLNEMRDALRDANRGDGQPDP